MPEAKGGLSNYNPEEDGTQIPGDNPTVLEQRLTVHHNIEEYCTTEGMLGYRMTHSKGSSTQKRRP